VRVKLLVVDPAVFERVSKFWVDATPEVVSETHCAAEDAGRSAEAGRARATIERARTERYMWSSSRLGGR
jgi:hypothetical protein